MVGVSIDLRHPFTRVTDGNDRGVADRRRPLIARVLWGGAAEYCAECGAEVSPHEAIRSAAARVYCSAVHAIDDQL